MIIKTIKYPLFLIVLAVVILGLVLVVFMSISSQQDPKSSNSAFSVDCKMTAANKMEIADLYDPVSPANRNAGAPEPPSQEEISNLVGDCEYDALREAYRLGARELRDLSDCGEDCGVTDDLRPYRITYKQVDGRITELVVAGY